MKLLMLLLFSMSSLLGQELLVKVDNLPLTEIENFHEAGLEVWEWNHEFSLVVCDEATIPSEYKTTILDKDPRGKNYFLVRPMEKIDYSQYSDYIDILWSDDNLDIITDKGVRPQGLKIRAEIKGVRKTPIKINKRRPDTRGGYIDQNPLIETLISYIDSATVFNYTKRLQDFVTRNNYHDSIINATTYIFDEFTTSGLDLVYYSESGTDPWGYPFLADNVVGIKYGETDSALIICGHLDATAGDPYNSEEVAPGADDNGSGSAGVLTAAKVMAPFNFHHELRFMCFVGEELGLYGSSQYADSCAGAGSNIIGVYNMDMIAHSDQGGVEDLDADDNYHTPSTFLADTLIHFGSVYVPALPIIEANLVGGSSDHASFQDAGYVAILTIDDAFIGANPYIHSTADTIGPSANDFTLATNAVKAVVATVAELAGIIDVGIADLPTKEKHQLILPSIVSGPFNCVLHIDEPCLIDLSLYALSGEKMLSLFHGNADERLALTIALPAEFPNGVYFLHIKDSNNTINTVKKIVVVNK